LIIKRKIHKIEEVVTCEKERERRKQKGRYEVVFYSIKKKKRKMMVGTRSEK
jgi:hypothetical protein